VNNTTSDILQVRGPGFSFSVLYSPDGLHLIDTGFWGGIRLLDAALQRRGWENIPIRGILLTHGHLDHVLNVHTLAARHKAWVAAPRLDADHCKARHHYTGISRVCGIMEATGRILFSYKDFAVDRWLDDGDEISVWGDLRAVHLPGHSAGHTGFYCPSRELLFCGDLFASYRFGSYMPPAIFNSCPKLLRPSLTKALALPLKGVFPAHGSTETPETHLERLRRLHSRKTPK
jgi:glyoxylase-like metal-dependent hydrolase (beta-lactamase superfamily II)